MVQRRTHGRCPHGDEGRPHPVWPEPGWPLGENAELDAALVELEIALTDCDTAIETAIAGLSSQDVSNALRSVPFDRRPDVLRPLGLMLQARHISQALCQDVRNRMQRADKHAAIHAASALTVEASKDIGWSAFADADGGAASPRDPLERWGTALCRLAVWSHRLASVRDARVWLWAAWQPWFRPDGVTDEQLEAIVEAAEVVVKVSPAFTPYDDLNKEAELHADDVDGQAEGARPFLDAELPGEESVGETIGVDPARSDAGIDNPERTKAVTAPADDQVITAEAPPDPSMLDNLAAASDALAALLAAGLLAAQTAVEQLRKRRLPTAVDVATLARTRADFDAVAEGLAAAGVQVAEESMAAIREAVSQAQALAGDDAARTLLEAVCALAAPEEQPMLEAQLAQAQAQARGLLTQRLWDQQARASAAILSLLVEMAAPDRDAARQMSELQQWCQARPDLSLLGVQAQQLRVPPASVGPGESAADTTETAAQPAEVETAAVTQPADHMEPAAENSLPHRPGHEQPFAAALLETPQAEARQADVLQGENADLAPAASMLHAPDSPDDIGEGCPVADRAVGSAGQPHTLVVPQAAETAEPVSDRGTSPPEPAAGADPKQVGAAIARLISAQRFGLAVTLADMTNENRVEQVVLRVAALAAAVRHQNGAVAAALRAEFDDLDSVTLAGDTPSLLLVIPALLRTALVTGDPATGALLTELAVRAEPNIAEIAEQVGRRALHGILLETHAPSVLADVTEAERGMRAITRTASQVRTRPRTLRFKRATDISKIWLGLGPRGILGNPLRIVERNDRSAIEKVVGSIEKISDSGFIKGELDQLDRHYQGSSGKPIEGAGRRDLLNLAQEALKPLGDWVAAVRSLDGRDTRAEHWGAGEVADMRAAVLARREGVLTAFRHLAGHDDQLTRAAAQAGAASLAGTFDILQNIWELPVRESAPALVLTAELLKVPGAIVDAGLGQIATPDGTTVRDVLAAADRSWDDALSAQVAAENFKAAYFLMDIADAGQLPSVAGPQATLSVTPTDWVQHAERDACAELDAEREEISTMLRQARLNNEISEEQDGELTSLLEDALRHTKDQDHANARRTLRRVEALLPEYRAQAKTRLAVRIEQLQRDGRVDDLASERVTRLIDDGQLSTAEELIYFLEIDEDVPEVYQSQDLRQFFPAVPAALPDGLTGQLITLVKERGRLEGCPALDFSGLSPDLAVTAAEALKSWRDISQTEPTQRSNISETGQLLPALRMIGIEPGIGGVRKLSDWPRSREWRFIEVTVNGIIGEALVPAFGSKLDGRLRLLLAWGRPSADLLMSWADGDLSGEGLLIAHFGTMSAQTRRDLAVRTVRRSAPVVVLDDAALAYLAAHGNRQMTATMNVLLPFSSVNPYLRQKRGVVAPEMFYGRSQERRNVLDPDGTQLVFGGRGLGKSALLNSAAKQFEAQTKNIGERIAVYLDLKAVGIRAGSAINQEAIWDALLDGLTRREVLAAPGRTARRMSVREQVQGGVQAWLDADSRRRLLVLLDEADQFFEADMPEFQETTRLKSLGQQSNGRVKVVFAGLHSVQRYAKRARNAPFGHMAQRPTVIGPLRPQHAANLVTRPLAALGFDFAEPDLVNRVLGYCSYQPFLLQIFANRLVEAMHNKRSSASLGTGEPPYVITRADVETVIGRADLRADISAAFHETLNLDHRYGVIAHVLAHHAHEQGLDARLTDTQLREECLSYWPIGFAGLDVEGFRAYLQEMTGLGVLAPNNDGRGWHLRSANVLRMVGTREDIQAQLVTAAELSVPDEFIALESRPELPGGRRSPLTAGQIDDVLGDHSNQVRVVLGSWATGIDDADDAVRAAANVGSRFSVPAVPTRRQFEEELVAGTPGDRRVILDNLVRVAPSQEACREALELAGTRCPTAPGVTRAAVIIAGPAQIGLWREVFTQRDDGTPGKPGRLVAETVTLRRYNAKTLRVWSLETAMFSSEERRALLLQATGGWPMLVERVAQLVKGDSGNSDGMDEADALRKVAAELATPAGAAGLVAAIGLSGDEQLSGAFQAVLSVIDSGNLTRADLHVAAGLSVDQPSVAVECLISLQVFDLDADGKFLPEPLLVRCWPQRA
ncbi:MAG: hypothetical protein ACRDRJ_07375 [Streptosporangiaceae bacterium]